MAKILLVNEFNTAERFELTQSEAEQLMDVGAAFFCLADSIYIETQGTKPTGEPVIALHAGLTHLMSEPGTFAQYVSVLNEYRGLAGRSSRPEDLNPFTGKVMKVTRPPKSGPESN